MFDEKEYFDPRKSQLNVNGTTLEPCSSDPLTGFLRDGCCSWDPRDIGSHTVCAIMTTEFLEFSKERGNDLSTPRPEYQFKGLKDGDRWCLVQQGGKKLGWQVKHLKLFLRQRI